MKSRIIDIRQGATARSLTPPKPNGIDVLEEITPEEGMVLTQVADVPVEERVIARVVTLGRGRSSDEWKEIPIEQGESILAEQQQIRLRRMEERRAALDAELNRR